MTTPTPDPGKDFAMALYYRVAELMKAGKTKEQIIYELGMQGVKRDQVEKMMSDLSKRIDERYEEAVQRKSVRGEAFSHILIGLVLCFFGFGLTFGWFGFVPAGPLAIYPTLLGVAAGLYWLVKGLLKLIPSQK
jgi:hypothetical protein